MSFTESEENYIKSIYHLQTHYERVNAGMLAKAVKTKAASVTDMLKKLNSKKLIHYKPYKSFQLTEAGKKIALQVIRKHRLWEFFLVNNLGFAWGEVHDIAEELEHITSLDLVTKLDEYLGHPEFDPHGDPIPNSKGKMAEPKQKSLAEIQLKKIAVVSYIKDQRETMMDLLTHYGIVLGTKLKVIRRFEFDGSVEIKVNQLAPAILSKEVAANIFCGI